MAELGEEEPNPPHRCCVWLSRLLPPRHAESCSPQGLSRSRYSLESAF